MEGTYLSALSKCSFEVLLSRPDIRSLHSQLCNALDYFLQTVPKVSTIRVRHLSRSYREMPFPISPDLIIRQFQSAEI